MRAKMGEGERALVSGLLRGAPLAHVRLPRLARGVRIIDDTQAFPHPLPGRHPADHPIGEVIDLDMICVCVAWCQASSSQPSGRV